MDYIKLLDRVLEKMAKLSAWRFIALLVAVLLIFLIWRLPEILAVVIK